LDHSDWFRPPHFSAEIAAVLARRKPDEALDDLLDLLNIERQTFETPEVHATALELAIRYPHHLILGWPLERPRRRRGAAEPGPGQAPLPHDARSSDPISPVGDGIRGRSQVPHCNIRLLGITLEQ